MNETNAVETTEAPAAIEATKPVAKAKAAKKPATKPAPKKAATAKATTKAAPAASGRAMAPVPAAERRAALLKLLRQKKATGALAAVATEELAAKLGYTPYDVYCLGYHKFPLAAGGYLKTTKTQEGGLAYYLTAKGQKSGPDDKPAK